MRFRMSCVTAAYFAMTLCAVAQQASLNTAAASAPAPVPRLIKYSGVAKDDSGKALSGTVGITFLLYKDEQGSAPLWLETQSIQADANGRYSVQLGATQASGLPADLFTSGDARWLGVQISGRAEQPRVLLLSVPYALKAGDAETVGGLPASAFMLAAPASANPAAAAAPNAASTPPPTSTPVTTTGGTVNYLPLWNTTSDIISSVLFQSGTGSTAKIGINTATPSSTLDVKGGGTIRGTLSLPAAGAATATKGANSQPLSMAASAFSSTTNTAVNQIFRWQAEPAGNNTSTASGTLNLLFAEGTAALAETGLNIASNGQITFAPGQTFPGVGTITGVVAGTDLIGGGTSGVVPLNLDTSKVPQLATANTFTGNQTVNGNIVTTGTVSAAAAAITGTSASALLSLTQSGSGPGIVLSSGTGSPALKVGSSGTTALQASTSSTPGFAILGIASATTGSATGVTGDSGSNAGSGVVGDEYSTTGNTSGVVGIVASPGGVAGVFNNSAGGNILLGSNNGIQKFLVDGSGNVTATGTGSFNTLAVTSNAQVANLNASLLGGQPAGSYVTTGSNTFNGPQYIGGAGTSATLQMDANGVNAGALLPGIRFGSGGSGEGLSSQRTGTGNLNGLDLYTDFTARLSIANGGNVGVGTRTPQSTLDVNGVIHAAGNTTPPTSVQGAYLGWNAFNNGTGETDLINNQGLGSGGFAFMNTPQSGSPLSTLMFINGSGSVGIGTNSPTSMLNVVGTQPSAVNSGAGTTAASILGITGGTGGNTSDGSGQIGGTGGSISISGGNGGNAPAGSTVGQGGTITLQPGAPGSGGGGCYFGGCGNNYGQLLLAPNGGVVGIGGLPCPYGGGCYFLLDVNGSALFNGDVWANGCVKANTTGDVLGGTCYSDARFKKDIQPFAPVLDRLVQIRPVSFVWTTEELPGYHLGTGRSMGIIAQEVEKVFPEMVSTDKNGYKKVNYSELPYLMLQAIRDLKTENEKLREQVAQVGELQKQLLQLNSEQARLDRLEAELEQLKGRKTEELAASHVSFK